MKKQIVLAAAALALVSLASCGNTSSEVPSTGASSSLAPSSSSAPAESSSEVPSSSEEVAESKYAARYVFISPGAAYDAETQTEGEANTLVSQVFENGKHSGPNYMLYVNLLKDGNKVEAGRRTLYYTGILANKKAFEASGTWTKNSDGTFKVAMDAFTAGVFENAASEMTSTADGNLTWVYSNQNSATSDPKAYETTLWTNRELLGEYTGTFKNQENEVAPFDSFTIEASTEEGKEGKIVGSVEDSGISAMEGSMDEFGVITGKTPRLDGTFFGFAYTDTDGIVKVHLNMEARERKSTLDGTHI